MHALAEPSAEVQELDLPAQALAADSGAAIQAHAHDLATPNVVEEDDGEDIEVPYNRLRLSADNARKKRSPEGIVRLSAEIAAQGLLHRLSVTEAEDGFLDVCAGGRRFFAIGHLVAEGTWSAERPIKCRKYAKERAKQITIAENNHEAMHPADEFVAFSRLVNEDGLTIAQVASRFGVSALTVERRLSLARLEPRFIDMFRDGKIDADQIKVLTLTNDHAMQVAAWESLPTYSRSAYHLKQAITAGEMPLTHGLVQFVSLADYEGAGGAIRRDLFAESNAGWILDASLLRTLANDKLAAMAEKEKAEGWSWVEVSAQHDAGILRTFDRLNPAKRKPTAEEAAALAEQTTILEQLRKDIEAAEDKLYGNSDEGDEEEGDDDSDSENLYAKVRSMEEAVSVHEEVIADIEEGMSEWPAKLRGRAGVVIGVEADGDVVVVRGLMKPQERKAAVKEMAAEGEDTTQMRDVQTATSKGKAVRADFSERLMLDMTSHRTAAMQAALIDNQHVALALVVHKMAEHLFDTGYRGIDSPLKLTTHLTQHTQLDKQATGYADTTAAELIGKQTDHLGMKVPGDMSTPKALAWYVSQSDETLMEILAFCAASSLDAMHGRERTEYQTADALADALELDMADWWTVSPANYLGSVSKDMLVAAVTEAMDAETARPLLGMKKADAVAYAAAKLEGTRWLPRPLRRKEVDAE